MIIKKYIARYAHRLLISYSLSRGVISYRNGGISYIINLNLL